LLVKKRLYFQVVSVLLYLLQKTCVFIQVSWYNTCH